MSIQLGKTQNRIEYILSKLGIELNDKEFLVLKKKQIYDLINYYNIIDENTPKIPLSFSSSLYQLVNNYYLLIDAKNSHYILLKDEKGELWIKTKTTLSKFKNEIKRILRDAGYNVKEIELNSNINYYLIIYPNKNTVLDSEVINIKTYGFYLEGTNFDVYIEEYKDNVIKAKIYSTNQLISILKDYIFFNYKEK